MRPQAGPIKRFQNTGTVSSGGLVQSRSEFRGTNNTRPPAANFFSASSQERVMRKSTGCGGQSSAGGGFQGAGGGLAIGMNWWVWGASRLYCCVAGGSQEV